jgi:hypothetical protein
MLLSALPISESKAKCKLLTADPLFLITVDSQKAFDVVIHIIMLDKMYETGVHPILWTIVKDLYDGLTSIIKWCGVISENFPIKQGVRQGESSQLFSTRCTITHYSGTCKTKT